MKSSSGLAWFLCSLVHCVVRQSTKKTEDEPHEKMEMSVFVLTMHSKVTTTTMSTMVIGGGQATRFSSSSVCSALSLSCGKSCAKSNTFPFNSAKLIRIQLNGCRMSHIMIACERIDNSTQPPNAQPQLKRGNVEEYESGSGRMNLMSMSALWINICTKLNHTL